MPIKFKYDLAAVPAISNQTTRRFGQALVEQQRQQDFAGQQQARQLGARDFQNATSNMSSYLQDMLDNNEITDEPTRRQLLALRSGVDTVMGSGFTDDQRRHYLNQYQAKIAGILANAPVKAKPTRDDELKGFLGSNYDKYKDHPWVPDGKGGFTIADIPQPEQPKLPEPKPPQPKTFGEYWQMEPEKARKALADKMAEIQDSISIGEGSIAPYKSVQDKALAELEKPFQIMQDRFGQPTQVPPSAGALPAPTTGASTGGPQGNAWGGIAQASGPLPAWRTEGRQFTYSSQPDVGDIRGVDATTGPTPEQIAALDAQTNDTMDSTNAQLAENQARAAEIKAGYAPRTNSLKRQADAMSNKTDRAQSYLDGELLPRSPQGERPSSMYDISDAKDKREAEQYAANQAEDGKYKAKRDQGDAALQTRENKPIDNPETMKQDARQFSSEYQLYKRGGGTLSTRDYITQMAKQGKLSPDLKRELEHNYKMDLSDQALAGIAEQDVLSQKGIAKEEAKATRDSKANRRKYPMGMPSAQQTPAPTAAPATSPASAANVAPTAAPANIPIAAPDPGKPPSPKRVSQDSTLPAPAVSAEQQARSGPDFSSLATNAADDADRLVLRKLQGIYEQSQSPEIQNAISVLVDSGADARQKALAARSLRDAGIDINQLTAPKPKPSGGRRGKLK